jgi:hypothetical protein
MKQGAGIGHRRTKLKLLTNNNSEWCLLNGGWKFCNELERRVAERDFVQYLRLLQPVNNDKFHRRSPELRSILE